MTSEETRSLAAERHQERLRQERQTFDQRRHQDAWSFTLGFLVRCLAVVLLIAVMIVAAYILLNSARFSKSVAALAGGAIFVDILGWCKLVLTLRSPTALMPVTDADSPHCSGPKSRNGCGTGEERPGDGDRQEA